MKYEALNSPEYEILSARLDLLFDVLWFCSQHQEVGRKYVFSVVERIQINQERGSLMSQQTAMLYPDEEIQVRHLTVPQTLETKIQFIKTKL